MLAMEVVSVFDRFYAYWLNHFVDLYFIGFILCLLTTFIWAVIEESYNQVNQYKRIPASETQLNNILSMWFILATTPIVNIMYPVIALLERITYFLVNLLESIKSLLDSINKAEHERFLLLIHRNKEAMSNNLININKITNNYKLVAHTCFTTLVSLACNALISIYTICSMIIQLFLNLSYIIITLCLIPMSLLLLLHNAILDVLCIKYINIVVFLCKRLVGTLNSLYKYFRSIGEKDEEN